MNFYLKIIVFILIGFLLSRIANLIFKLIAKKKQSVHVHFFKSLTNVLIVVLTLYTLAQQFDVTKDLSTTLLQSGSLIIAIATFAAQHALSNVVSGFSLSFSKPYEVEDKVKVVQGGNIIAEGIVKDITLRHTVIRQYNGESCIVPNSVMDSAVITNSNYTDNIGNFLEVEITYESDADAAIQIMKKVCADHALTLNTMENNVFVKGYTANGITLKTTIWTNTLDDNFRACSDIRKALVTEFAKSQIQIPYQTVTIHADVPESSKQRITE